MKNGILPANWSGFAANSMISLKSSDSKEDFSRKGEQILRPAVEAYVEDDTFRVRMDLPGIDSANIDVKVTGGTLTIKGSREQKLDTTKQDYFQREIRYGSFERSISMPEGIKAEDLKASYRDGVLELTAPMPKQSTAAGVKIEVKRTHDKD